MANKSTVANDLRRFATFVKGLTDAADTLDQMQSLEELASATEQRVTAAQAALADVTAQVEVAQADLAATCKESQESVARANDKAQQLLDTAVAQAAAIVEEGKQSAQLQAAALLAEATKQHDDKLLQVSTLGDQLLRMTDDLTALTAQTEAQTAALIEVEDKLTAARSAVAKLFG